MKSISSCLLVLILGASSGCKAQSMPCSAVAQLDRADIKATLDSGEFSGVFDEDAKISYVGCYSGDGKELGVFYYSRVFGNLRMTQRLLVISGTREYLGMYEVADKPTSIEGAEIRFPYSEEAGNSISLLGGSPPSQIRLDGEIHTLFK